jgi:hypothetical protein
MKFYLSFVFSIISVLGFSQYTLSGKVLSNSGDLIGAEVSLYKMKSDIFHGSVTGIDGTYLIDNIEQGDYRLVVNYLGFKKYRKRLTIDSNTAWDDIILENDVLEIDGVEITGTMIQAIQKGDTTVFNAAVFKTLPDADARELIAKIPGIQIEGGTVKANGENVTSVTVDGREFFGNDPNVALNALPAEIIAKIEIIDQQSEQSQFSGFDDGNTTKTINIVTKTDKRNGEFGKIYAGFGQEKRYQAGGNLNIFNGNQRTSIIGLSNNVNQQNFSTDDLLGVTGSSGNNRRGRRGGRRGRGGINNFLVGQQPGIAETNSVGLNFSDKWGDKVDFSGSYFYNEADNVLDQDIEQEYFAEDTGGDIYIEDNLTESGNQNHRVQARLNIELNDKNTIRIQPRISWQDNTINEFSDSEFLRQGSTPDIANNIYSSDQSGLNLNNSIRFRHAFEKRGRTLSLSLGNSYAPKNGITTLETNLSRDTTENDLTQFSTNDNRDWGIQTEISYTEPVSENAQISFEYEFEKDNGEDDQNTTLGTTIDAGIPLPSLSNDLITEQQTHTASTGYRWRKEKTMIIARARVENVSISADQSVPSQFMSDKCYTNFLPFVMARMEFSNSQNLRIYYRPRTDNPSATQLTETIDNSNPLQLSKGNIDIEQGYQHSLFARFSSTDKEKGTVLYVFAGGDYSSNFIGQRTYLSGRGNELYEMLDIDPRAQLTVPENLSGYINLRSYVTIGLPVTAIKSKLNFNINANYTNTPNLIDSLNNNIANSTLGFGTSLTSNISDRVDFTVSSNTNIGIATNMLQPEQNTNFVNQNTGLKLDVIFPWGIIWRNQINHQLYRGYGDGFDDSYLLGIMSIGKKFLKNDRGEVSVSVFDLFNQNQAINRTVNSTYIESTSSNVLQRYFMVNVKYDLRNFGKSNAAQKRETRGDRRGGRF